MSTSAEPTTTTDVDTAIQELNNILIESSDMFSQMKKLKFDYLVQICQLYFGIDFPSIMMEKCRKEVFENAQM